MTKVEVTRKHIDDGVRESCELCPIARATKDVVRDNVQIDVLPRVMIVFVDHGSKGCDRSEIPLPSEADSFIANFDAGRDVHPITLELDIPDRFLKETA